jgi:hypothetical protein
LRTWWVSFFLYDFPEFCDTKDCGRKPCFLFGVCCFPVSVVESCCFFKKSYKLFLVFDRQTKPIKERERERVGRERGRERESLKLM